MTESYVIWFRYHCGPYSDKLGIYLLDMADILLIEMGRIQEARKYLTEVTNYFFI